MTDTRTWFITGCSSGLGQKLAQQLLERGDRVAVTARNPATLEHLVAIAPDRVVALKLDVTDKDNISSAVAAARDHFGQIDALVNNAGFGHHGSIEEMSIDDVRTVFETNFFSAYQLIQAVLPDMRKRRRGWIVNIASFNGIMALPMASAYSTSKFALIGLSESLRFEVEPLGIKVMVAEPGPIDTGFASNNNKFNPSNIPEYDIEDGFRRAGVAGWVEQGNAPESMAAAIITALDRPEPPLHLPLGHLSLNAAKAKLAERIRGFDEWAEISLRSDLPPAA